MSNPLHGKRSFTGKHTLLPATLQSETSSSFVPKLPTYTFLTWTFGRGSVLWKIWPAVLLHTLFAACVVYAWVATGSQFEIPNVMLTVMGVVIGFVISYRAMSGYDRYWIGRTTWTDVIRNARTTSRLIWYHIPLRLAPRTPDEAIGARRPPPEMLKVMAEKRMALDLVEGFAVALKHHLRGEVGIYYEDLYELVRPLHDYEHSNISDAQPHSTVAVVPSPPQVASPTAGTQYGTFAASSVSSSSATLKPSSMTHASRRPAASNSSTTSLTSSSSESATPTATGPAMGTLGTAHASEPSLSTPLLPASNPGREDAVLRRVAPEMIAFSGLFSSISRVLARLAAHRAAHDEHHHHHRRGRLLRHWAGPMHPSNGTMRPSDDTNATRHVHSAGVVDGILHRGQNLPEEVLRCLSEWFGVLEERGTVPGTSLGALIGCIQAFEASLTTLEQVLTTPLPFVYSSHIRVVWLYLFLLPLQLVNNFGWHTVPAVAVGAFVYLGFVAAGEEIEQPFGYDDNDLDLDMFCRDIIRPDVQFLKTTPCANAYFEPALQMPDTAADGNGNGTTMGHRASQSATSLLEDTVESEEDGDGV